MLWLCHVGCGWLASRWRFIGGVLVGARLLGAWLVLALFVVVIVVGYDGGDGPSRCGSVEAPNGGPFEANGANRYTVGTRRE